MPSTKHQMRNVQRETPGNTPDSTVGPPIPDAQPPLCEPILTQHVTHTRQPADSSRPTTHFVSQSSQSGCLRAGRRLIRRLWGPLCERILTSAVRGMCGGLVSAIRCALCESNLTQHAIHTRQTADSGRPTTHFVSESSQSWCRRAGFGLSGSCQVPLCEPILTRQVPASREPLHSDAGQPRLTRRARRTDCCTSRRRNHPCRAVPDAYHVR